MIISKDRGNIFDDVIKTLKNQKISECSQDGKEYSREYLTSQLMMKKAEHYHCDIRTRQG